jgi:DNA-binding NtrC family response regulator
LVDGMEAALDALLGESPRMVAIRADLARLLGRQSIAGRLPPILILGETGTGKGLLARAIHEAGPRRTGPFVAVNCAAIPDTMAEAELFGYERGAFTDARQAKAGLFQAAHGGTLFLDEIGLLPLALQGKLLAALEDRAVRRLGSTRAEPVDLAVVAATSVDLKRAIGEGQFREDLYHRLAVVSFELPRLCERGCDILRLADHFLARATADYGLPARTLAPDARDLLLAYHWPGNVRELGNVLERAALLSAGDEITAAMLKLPAGNSAVPTETRTPSVPGSLDDAMRARIEASLRASGGRIRQAAVALGISRNTLRARMDKYGLRQHEARATPATLPVHRAGDAVSSEWEHRHLAFLRVQLFPSPPANVARTLMEIADKIHSFGGQIEESNLTGLIAVFGLEPLDNAPSHAALAALAVHGATAHDRSASSGRIDAVIAIDCGDHLVRRQDAIFNIAVSGKAVTWPVLEDLVAVETPGATVVTAAVVPFVARRFALERLRDPHRHAWVLLGRKDGPATWTRFVGRSAEIAVLRKASERAERGHGQVVSIVGEAGVGKSRLTREAVRQLHGWRIVSGHGEPYAANTPYFPIVAVLKSFCGIREADTADEVRMKLAQSIPTSAGSSEWLGSALLDLLGVLPPEDPFRAADPAMRRRRTHDALRQIVVAASFAQPLCLIIEDLQWIDVATREVLDRLINGIATARVLLLVNFRPEFQNVWGQKAHHSQVRLDALPTESASELLDVLVGTDPKLAPLKQQLAKNGNPFFLEEMVRALAETKALEGRRGRYRLAKPVQALEMPPTVRSILAARVDRLAPEDKRLLQIAAVIGENVPLALLQAIAERPEEQLRRELEGLEAAEFIVETGMHADVGYRFKHPLTREVAYGTLAEDRRKALHAGITRAIEEVYPDRLTEHVGRLAHHAVQGELWEQAITYLQQAALKELTRSANREAVNCFEQALHALDHLPEGRETLKRAIDLRLDLTTALIPLGAFDRIVGHLREAEGLASRLDDRRRLGRLYVNPLSRDGLLLDPRLPTG